MYIFTTSETSLRAILSFERNYTAADPSCSHPCVASCVQEDLKARRRMLGNIQFIGELFKEKMLTEKIMHECIVKLLGEAGHPGPMINPLSPPPTS